MHCVTPNSRLQCQCDSSELNCWWLPTNFGQKNWKPNKFRIYPVELSCHGPVSNGHCLMCIEKCFPFLWFVISCINNNATRSKLKWVTTDRVCWVALCSQLSSVQFTLLILRQRCRCELGTNDWCLITRAVSKIRTTAYQCMWAWRCWCKWVCNAAVCCMICLASAAGWSECMSWWVVRMHGGTWCSMSSNMSCCMLLWKRLTVLRCLCKSRYDWYKLVLRLITLTADLSALTTKDVWYT